MRNDIRRRHDAHVRVNGVCFEHRALFDATPGGRATRSALGTSIAEVDRLLAVQTRSNEDRRASTEERRVARQALRNAAKAVVAVGRLVRVDAITTTAMQLPRKASDDELVADARGLVNRVSAYVDAFVAVGLPPDALNHVQTAIRKLAAARDAGASARQRFAAAAALIRDAQNASRLIIAALEAIAINLPAANPEVVTKLRLARRVGRRRESRPASVLRAPGSTPASSMASEVRVGPLSRVFLRAIANKSALRTRRRAL
jgi:hypothetical protein